MAVPYKPEGYNSVSVYIVADDPQRIIDFLKQAFEASELRRYERPDGSLMHAEVRVGDTVIMLAGAGGQWPAFPVWLHVYVPGVDATYQKALAAGGVSVQEPVRKGDPDKRGGVKDPAGNTWWIATQGE